MNTKDFHTHNELFAYVCMEELHRLGVQDFFVAPGSRSTPLVLALHQLKKMNVRLNVTVHHDERGLAYMALGRSMVTKKASVIITTSGSAVANLLPAALEAKHSRVPLLMLTADRPFELRNAGSNQTIDQIDILNNACGRSVDFACPSENLPLEAWLSTINQSYQSAANGRPVHMNFQFREPLVPNAALSMTSINHSKSFTDWRNSIHPISSHVMSSQLPIPTQKDLEALERCLKGKCVLIAGGFLSKSDATSVVELAERLQAPVLVDVLSSLRFRRTVYTLDASDLLIDVISTKLKNEPDQTLIWFGGRLQSKRISKFVSEHKGPIIQVNNFLEREDDKHLSKQIWHSDVDHFVKICNSLIAPLKSRSSEILKPLQALNNEARVFQGHLLKSNESEKINEIYTTSKVIELAAKYDFQVFSGNSMPIRDFERFSPAQELEVSFFANRGTSGIDGCIATFAGIASTKPTIGVIGDLAFLHDVSSLPLLKKITCGVLLVINNNGGGIFSFLPVSKTGEAFEPYFATPHSFDLTPIAKSFELEVLEPKNLQEFNVTLENALKAKNLTILIVNTDRLSNKQLHEQVNEAWLKAYN